MCAGSSKVRAERLELGDGIGWRAAGAAWLLSGEEMTLTLVKLIGSTRNLRGLASHVAQPAMDPALNTSSERPAARRL